MTQRNRAWRRRQTRHIASKIKATKEWLKSRWTGEETPREKLKRENHSRSGKLTRVQQLRQAWRLNSELAEGFFGPT